MERGEIGVVDQTKVVGAGPWLQALRRELISPDLRSVARFEGEGASFDFCIGRFGIWIIASNAEGGLRVAFLAAWCPSGSCVSSVETSKRGQVELYVETAIGKYCVRANLRAGRAPLLHWTTNLTPERDLLPSFWPRDTYPIDADCDPLGAHGIVHFTQPEYAAPLLFASATGEQQGSFLYMQNLTSLNSYFETTKTSPNSRVSGRWPELGFSLPPTEEHCLEAGKAITIADAYVRLAPPTPENEREAARLFNNLYADIYLALPRRESLHRDWPRRVAQTIRDLTHSPECSMTVEDNRYLLAYIGSDDRPVESMVQLAILTPLVEYQRVCPGTDIPLIEELREGLSNFYNAELGTIVRWLPGQESLLRNKEEHMKPMLMDSWYLHHPLLNLARLASFGDEKAKRLFLDSVDYAVKVARHFEYRWPIFYDMKTLESPKKERAPGKGGELDVAAQYAHVMLHAWDLTQKNEYLEEAERAAQSLVGLGFDLVYQMNNTAFGAGGLARLAQITGNDLYRELSEVCFANIFRHLWLWECDYGHGAHYHTFMGLPPLQEAKYLALYEELEVLAAFHEYLRNAGEDVPSSIRVIVCEYCRHLIDRAWYHYPSEIPETLLAEESQSGHLNRYISIPLEDIYDGWQKAGAVGQEIYGAAAPFVFSTRHCNLVEGLNFALHCNYPTTDFTIEKRGARTIAKGGVATMRVQGDKRLKCELRIVPQDYFALPEVVVKETVQGETTLVEGKLNEFGHLEFALQGDAEITIQWGAGIPTNGKGGMNGKAKRTAAPGKNGNGNGAIPHEEKKERGRGKRQTPNARRQARK